ncbi:hypothetical protein [Rubrivivax sp. JA1026]|uniref:hypothetical protein n=1 Tax=Rubrivivax sp. JA1026 TaxID=2710888 RepID=UPI0013E931B1|nr:hypothetical protein [Rubrivivax sp. JA1026]
MLFFFSSDSAPRYRQDILRALAMPAGARLQFRYRLRHVALGLHDRIEGNQLVDADVCLSYVDTSDQNSPPAIAPVRAGKVAYTEVQGDFCVFEFALAGFAFAQDIDVFNRQIRTQSGNLPMWKDGKVVGHFCEEIATQGLPLRLDADTGEWQKICETLAKYPAYQAEPMFYRLEGVYESDSNKPVPCAEGTLELQSGKLYDVRLLHYSPKAIVFPARLENKDLNWLTADADEKVLTFVGTRALAIDSGYDRKTVRFRAAVTATPLDARLSLSRRPVGATKPEEDMWDFDLHARIKPAWLRLVGLGLVIGLPVAIQGMILALSNEKVTYREYVVIAVAILGLVGGVLTTMFGTKKS